LLVQASDDTVRTLYNKRTNNETNALNSSKQVSKYTVKASDILVLEIISVLVLV